MKIKLTLIAVLFAWYAQAQEWQVGNTTLTENDLVTGIQVPWEIMWGPDDHLWVTERRGRVLRVDPSTGNYTTVLNIQSVITGNGSSEPGMLGMVAHPDFDNNPYIYVVYNYGNWPNISQRLSRWMWDGSSLENEEIILDDIDGGGIHNGSRLLVLPDNTLLMTVGDRGATTTSQNLNNLNGKTLRMNLDGSIPADNPFGPDSYVWSFGHRNSQGLCLGPNGLVYSSEHGAQNDDEFNILMAGRNYGWPEVEGMCNGFEQDFCDDNDVVEPLDTWSPCIAVNGIFYYDHPSIPEWQNAVLMSVLGGLGGQYERLSVLHMSDDGTAIESEEQYFSSFNQRVRDVAVNPNTGAVYVAFNGPGYPGSGPNIIKEFINLEWGNNSIAENVEQELLIYPVPADDQLNVEFDASFVGSAYSIVSFTGQVVKQDVIMDQKINLNINEWAAGQYYIVATSDQGTVTKTFIVK